MNSYTYLVILALHMAALVFFGGAVLVTELRRLGMALPSYPVSEVIEGLRVPKRVGLGLAVVSGALLFGAHPGQYLHSPWFWTKIGLLALILLNRARQQAPRVTAGVSLALWAGVIVAGRGPATVKDVMHSMTDPAGDFLFASVERISDEHGTREKAPKTDADWDEVRQRLAVLRETPALLEGREAARARDRSRNPQSESQPEEIQKAMDADRANFQRRARMLQDAAGLGMKAADAKDKQALLQALDRIDKACENCHLHYWYPNDKRAQEAAREDGVTDF